jgi:hypothetical protein
LEPRSALVDLPLSVSAISRKTAVISTPKRGIRAQSPPCVSPAPRSSDESGARLAYTGTTVGGAELCSGAALSFTGCSSFDASDGGVGLRARGASGGRSTGAGADLNGVDVGVDVRTGAAGGSSHSSASEELPDW